MGNSLFISVYKVIDRKLIEIPGLFNCFNEKQQHEEMFNKAYKVAEKESFNQPVLVESSTDYNDASEISVWVNGHSVFIKEDYGYESDEICVHSGTIVIEEIKDYAIPAFFCKDCSRIVIRPPT
jgi:hypothetical protein